MLLNLTNSLAFTPTDNLSAGIYCESCFGPSYGDLEFYIDSPLNGEGKLRSYVNDVGFRIADKDEINTLTGDKLIIGQRSESTLLELEVW